MRCRKGDELFSFKDVEPRPQSEQRKVPNRHARLRVFGNLADIRYPFRHHLDLATVTDGTDDE